MADRDNESRKDFVVRYILNEWRDYVQSGRAANSAYDIWLPDRAQEHSLFVRCAEAVKRAEPAPPESLSGGYGQRVLVIGGESPLQELARNISPILYDLVWQLCVRGVLRPGVRNVGAYTNAQGQGYSLTARGHTWLLKHTDADVLDLLANL